MFMLYDNKAFENLRKYNSICDHRMKTIQVKEQKIYLFTIAIQN